MKEPTEKRRNGETENRASGAGCLNGKYPDRGGRGYAESRIPGIFISRKMKMQLLRTVQKGTIPTGYRTVSAYPPNFADSRYTFTAFGHFVFQHNMIRYHPCRSCDLFSTSAFHGPGQRRRLRTLSPQPPTRVRLPSSAAIVSRSARCYGLSAAGVSRPRKEKRRPRLKFRPDCS